MSERRDIDERDLDRLLVALTDTQIAALFGMSNVEVFQLRQSRQAQFLKSMSSGPNGRAGRTDRADV